MFCQEAVITQIWPRIWYRSYAKIDLHYQIMDQEEKGQRIGTGFNSSDFLIELISRSRQGDSQAMGAIYEHFKTPLFSLAYRYTHNSAVAEDLLQDIFIKIFTRIQDLEKDEAFVGWLYRIAINTCLSYLRGRKRLLQKTISLNEVEGIANGRTFDAPDRMINKPLEDAIQSLPTKLKSVFLLHDVQGFKHEEIAQIMECSLGTSKSQLFKARMKIRKQLEDKQI